MVLWSAKHMQASVTLLRWTLAVIFVWFGALKLAGYNPVYDLIASVSPWMAVAPGLQALGAFEVLVGLGLLTRRFRSLTHLLLVLHLAGTFLTFVTGPSIVFAPAFPILSLAGEFVIKNLTLAMAGIVVLVHEKHREAMHRG